MPSSVPEHWNFVGLQYTPMEYPFAMWQKRHSSSPAKVAFCDSFELYCVFHNDDDECSGSTHGSDRW
jgi:hypothetical protein